MFINKYWYRINAQKLFKIKDQNVVIMQSHFVINQISSCQNIIFQTLKCNLKTGTYRTFISPGFLRGSKTHIGRSSF